MAELRLTGVRKRFGEVLAIDDLSLSIDDGEFFVLLGPSGAGKTTTLRLVAGLERPDAGSVHIGGQDVTACAPALRDVAFVFQQYSLYPHLNVYDNLAFPLRSPRHRHSQGEIHAKVTEVARLLRIEDKLGNPATRLSGGQMQRVAIGRALVRNPALYLMDEPLSSLDAKLRNDLRLELKRIQQDLGNTMLYVTHDQIEAMTLANRIGVLEQGCLVQVGTPQQIYEDPISTYVAARLGSPRINLLPCQTLALPDRPVRAHTIGIRAEHLRIAGAGGAGLPARVRRTERLSDQYLVHLSLGDEGNELVSAVPRDDHHSPGDTVRIDFVQPLWFDADGRRIAA